MSVRLSSFIKGYRRVAVLAPLFKLFEAVLELCVPLAVASLIDNGIARGDMHHILMMALLMVVLAILGLAASVTAQYFSARAAAGFAEKMKSALFRHITSLSEIDRDIIGSPALITRLTNDSNLVQNGINMFLRLFMRSPFIVFGAAVMAFTVDSSLAVIFAVVIPVLGFVVFLLMRYTVPMYSRVQGALDKVLSRTRENLSGVRVLRAFGKERNEEKAYGADLEALRGLQMSSGRVSALMNPLTYVIINFAVAVLISCGRTRYNLGLAEAGTIVALVNYMSQILAELIKLANLIITIARAIASGKRIQAVFNLEPSMSDAPDAVTEGSDKESAVEFRDVSLIYREGGEPSLSSVSFSVRRGEHIGIIGGTGSGKTTLVSLIPRFYDVSSGSVSVFGTDVRKWKRSALRSSIGYVQQKAVLFKGSIRDNIRWGRMDASDDEIKRALERAEAYSFVMERKGGLDSPVEEGGKNLSGGQRQRLSIARALVRCPEILILDDSSSALDYATEARLRHNLSELDGLTVITVSQRAGSLMTMDKIIVLDRGRIADMGTHDELMGRCELYREIYSSQFGGEA